MIHFRNNVWSIVSARVALPYDFDALRRELLQMPARYRRLLVLDMANELDEEEVAKDAGVPASAIRMRLARGKELLRSKLEDRTGTRSTKYDRKSFTGRPVKQEP